MRLRFNNLKSAGTKSLRIMRVTSYSLCTTIIQSPAQIGYNGQLYNFQMLVPENMTVRFNNPAVYYCPVSKIK